MALRKGSLRRSCFRATFLILFVFYVGFCTCFLLPRPSFPRRSAPASVPVKKIRPYETFYFTQILDHFTFKDVLKAPEVTFQQRYLVVKEFWHGAEKAGPIFVYCGNEGDIEWFAENSGFLFEIAPRFGALLLFPEHRYYGKSLPFGSRGRAYKDADSLSYLTTEQALADFAALIVDFKKNLSAEASPVVAFGGSYGGMLAAWFRLKYPHIVIGALASSAPILQFENLVSSDTFNKIVSLDFKVEGNACFETIRNSWNAIEALAVKESGLHNLSMKFRLCSDIQDASALTNWLYSAYSYLAMVNYPYAANFIMPLPAYPIREVCKAISSLPDDSDILSRIYAGANIYYNFTGEAQCFNIDDDPHGMSGWGWQACTEMIMPMSSNPNNSMVFPYAWDLQAYVEGCLKTYSVNARPNWMVTHFGGQDVKAILKHFGSNIIFSNGLLDPWSGGSVLEDVSSTIIAIVTKEGAHHLDLRSSTKEDPGWLVDQRELEISKIRQWLGEFYETLVVF